MMPANKRHCGGEGFGKHSASDSCPPTKGFFGGGGYTSHGEYMIEKNLKLQEQFASATSNAGDDKSAKPSIFHGLTFWMTGRTCIPDHELKRLIVEHGGIYEQYGYTRVSHIIADNLATGNQTWRELSKRVKRGHIVTSSWIVDCTRHKRRIPEIRYMPKCIAAKSTLLSFIDGGGKPDIVAGAGPTKSPLGTDPIVWHESRCSRHPTETNKSANVHNSEVFDIDSPGATESISNMGGKGHATDAGESSWHENFHTENGLDSGNPFATACHRADSNNAHAVALDINSSNDEDNNGNERIDNGSADIFPTKTRLQSSCAQTQLDISMSQNLATPISEFEVYAATSAPLVPVNKNSNEKVPCSGGFPMVEKSTSSAGFSFSPKVAQFAVEISASSPLGVSCRAEFFQLIGDFACKAAAQLQPIGCIAKSVGLRVTLESLQEWSGVANILVGVNDDPTLKIQNGAVTEASITLLHKLAQRALAALFSGGVTECLTALRWVIVQLRCDGLCATSTA